MIRWNRSRWHWIVAAGSMLGCIAVAVWAVGRNQDVRAARKAAEERRFALASEILNHHLAAHPADSSARLLAARIARRQGQLELAYDHLHQIQKDSHNQAALRLEYRLLTIMQGDLLEAEAALAQCRSRPEDPDSTLVLEALIEGVLNSLAPPFSPHTPFAIEAMPPLVAKAQDLIAMWLDSQHQSADQRAGLVWRARVRQISGDHAGARADLQAVLAAEPSSFEARFYYALFITPESPEQARDWLRELAQKKPNDPNVIFGYATVLRMTGALDEAARQLDHLIELFPRHPAAHLTRGLVALDAEKLQEAEPALQQALKLSGDNPEVLLALARCMRLQGRADEAKQFQDRYLELEAEKKKRMSTS